MQTYPFSSAGFLGNTLSILRRLPENQHKQTWNWVVCVSVHISLETLDG